MEYQAIEKISQIVALVFFICLFIGICIYAFWPRNKKQFDEAAEIPLKNDSEPEARD